MGPAVGARAVCIGTGGIAAGIGGGAATGIGGRAGADGLSKLLTNGAAAAIAGPTPGIAEATAGTKAFAAEVIVSQNPPTGFPSPS
jgi:hypothetical protein